LDLFDVWKTSRPVLLILIFLKDSPTEVTHNPLPKEEEIQWILNEVEHYLSPGKSKVISSSDLYWRCY
jgi:hypothetical protein